MAIPPTPEPTPTPGPTPPGPTPPGPTPTSPPAPPSPLVGAPYAIPPGPLAAPAPGQPTYYPQQAYYAPGWTAPAAATPRRSRRGLWLAVGGALVILLVVGGAAVGVTHWMRTRTLSDVSGPTTANARQVDTGHCIADLPRDGEVGDAVAGVHLASVGSGRAGHVAQRSGLHPARHTLSLIHI